MEAAGQAHAEGQAQTGRAQKRQRTVEPVGIDALHKRSKSTAQFVCDKIQTDRILTKSISKVIYCWLIVFLQPIDRMRVHHECSMKSHKFIFDAMPSEWIDFHCPEVFIEYVVNCVFLNEMKTLLSEDITLLLQEELKYKREALVLRSTMCMFAHHKSHTQDRVNLTDTKAVVTQLLDSFDLLLRKFLDE